jgi:hypothetical protein
MKTAITALLVMLTLGSIVAVMGAALEASSIVPLAAALVCGLTVWAIPMPFVLRREDWRPGASTVFALAIGLCALGCAVRIFASAPTFEDMRAAEIAMIVGANLGFPLTFAVALLEMRRRRRRAIPAA